MGAKILVTGGAGFIGSAIIQKLQNSNHQIFVIDDLSFGNRDFIKIPDSDFLKASILERKELMAFVEKIQPEWILHLAAVHFIPYCNQHPYESARINIEGTINVMDAAASCSSVKKVFFASTAAVYPISNTAVDERHETGPMDIYGLSKLAGEKICHQFHLSSGIPTVICRFFNAFGPNETNPHLIPEIQNQVNSGLRTIKLGNLTPKRDFIHTYDMANAVEMLMNKVESGYEIFNLGRGIEYSVTEIVEAFERQLGEKITIEQDPSRIRKVERMHLLADVAKLKNIAGWEPVWTLDDGIKTLVK
ncbi:MAG TPA: NAD(P)-dependent oxidoreductase [Flavobacteriales bacterium]|nr:NAD(P)-dependent oxidoreductase [Flavobacteriales bacterium]